jgi:hypothetical protein
VLLFPALSFAQSAAGYSNPESLDSIAQLNAIQQYHKLLSPENALYNGGEYIDYTTTLKTGYPYFGPDTVQEGWVVYDGTRYDHLLMWFDLVSQSLVLENPEHIYKMELLKTRLQSFSISGHYFVQLKGDSINGIRSGFYERMYQGRVSLYKRSRKNIQETTGNRVVERIVYADSAYYLERNGHFLPFGRKSQVNSVLGEKRKQVAAYMRKNQMSLGRALRRDKEGTLLKIVTYYDGL